MVDTASCPRIGEVEPTTRSPLTVRPGSKTAIAPASIASDIDATDQCNSGNSEAAGRAERRAGVPRDGRSLEPRSPRANWGADRWTGIGTMGHLASRSSSGKANGAGGGRTAHGCRLGHVDRVRGAGASTAGSRSGAEVLAPAPRGLSLRWWGARDPPIGWTWTERRQLYRSDVSRSAGRRGWPSAACTMWLWAGGGPLAACQRQRWGSCSAPAPRACWAEDLQRAAGGFHPLADRCEALSRPATSPTDASPWRQSKSSMRTRIGSPSAANCEAIGVARSSGIGVGEEGVCRAYPTSKLNNRIAARAAPRFATFASAPRSASRRCIRLWLALRVGGCLGFERAEGDCGF